MLQIAWGGSGAKDWHGNNNHVTFRFTALERREQFLQEAPRLLPGKWSLVQTNDNDDARPGRQ
jgi:hypothetical protein